MDGALPLSANDSIFAAFNSAAVARRIGLLSRNVVALMGILRRDGARCCRRIVVAGGLALVPCIGLLRSGLLRIRRLNGLLGVGVGARRIACDGGVVSAGVRWRWILRRSPLTVGIGSPLGIACRGKSTCGGKAAC